MGYMMDGTHDTCSGYSYFDDIITKSRPAQCLRRAILQDEHEDARRSRLLTFGESLLSAGMLRAP